MLTEEEIQAILEADDMMINYQAIGSDHNNVAYADETYTKR